MVEPSSLIVMDSVFASNDLPTKAVLLNAIHDFLLTQVERVKKDPEMVTKTSTSSPQASGRAVPDLHAVLCPQPPPTTLST